VDKKPLIERCLAVGIILLFVGTCIIPLTAQDTEKPLPLSRGSWLYVGGSGPGNYTRIQDAINDSNEGDTVFVYDDSSPYRENLKITQNSLTLLGENTQTTILICYQHEVERAILITGESVHISGFTLMQQGYQTLYFVIASNHVQITNNIIIGLEVWLPVQTSQCIISKNIIKGIYGTSGIIIYGKYNTISDNEITECGTGIFVGQGDGSYQVRPFGNIVTRNNFINNSRNAGFATAWCTLWRNNYWDDYQGSGAYEIRGKLIFLRGEDKPSLMFDWKNFDRHPAQNPFDIGG
jgi:hypothetical protein